VTAYLIDTEVQNTEYDMPAPGDTLLVTNSGSIINPFSESDIVSEVPVQHITIDGLVSGNGFDVVVEGTFTSVIVNGEVSGTGAGISLESGSDSVVNSGTISENTGILARDSSETQNIENSGTIEGIQAAISSVVSPGDSGAGISLVNSGSGLLTNANAAGNPEEGSSAVLYFDDSAGSVSTIDNQGAITGAGYVIQSAADILDISNSGTIDGGLYSTAPVSVDNSGHWQASAGGDGLLLNDARNSVTNAQAGTITGAITISGALDMVNNAGAIDGSVTLRAGFDTFTNAGSIDGAITFNGTGGNNTLTNSGSITGDVTLAGASSVFKNHNQIYGDVTLGRSETLINTGVIHGDVTLGASDSINDSRGKITDAITASSNDTFVYNGLFGEETINKFVAGSGAAHDTIQFAANDFGSFAAIHGAMLQVGADTLIRLDAADSITLVGVDKSSLVAADFKFV
jgi:hypothetical protein